MKRFDISTFVLHIIAMIFMLCDHLWATLIPGNQWLTCIKKLNEHSLKAKGFPAMESFFVF